VRSRGGATPSSRPGCGKKGAIFAGELSGHYYYRDMGFTDNGLLTLVMVANIVAARGKPLSELIRPLDPLSLDRGDQPPGGATPTGCLRRLRRGTGDADLDHLDGLTVGYPAWWFNIRRSHTEPVVRLNLEADTESLLDEKRQEVFGIIREVEAGVRVAGDRPTPT